MKNYLSFGGGVNSVAMMLYLLDEGWNFEAIFVNHQTDYPETYEYFDMFQKYLIKNNHKPITVLKPECYKKKDNLTFNNLYNYSWEYKMVPSVMIRWCTNLFKLQPIYKYIDKPCFMLIGFDWGEAKRAKISVEEGVENRFPLIEAEITRDDCKKIIKNHGLPVPMKSGCFICPFQSRRQWIELRKNHPELFCKAQELEKRNMEYRLSKNKKPLTLSPSGKSLDVIVNEKQIKLFQEDEYPPCQCML